MFFNIFYICAIYLKYKNIHHFNHVYIMHVKCQVTKYISSIQVSAN